MQMAKNKDKWLENYRTLIKQAEKEEGKKAYDKAVDIYLNALDLVPEPKKESTYATTIYIAIGEVRFFYEKNYIEALKYFKLAVEAKGGLGLAHIHLRLGQIRYEQGELKKAKDELMRAYMGAGQIIFDFEDIKYFELIKDLIKK